MADTKKKRGDDDKKLADIRRDFDTDFEEWSDIRTEGDTDMRYCAGDPWDPKDKQERADAGRPCLALDELSQYHNQVINDTYMNPVSVKFSPAGGGGVNDKAADKTADFYGDKWREIEYRSNAQIAYDTAFKNCLQRSYGWVRLTTRRESPRSTNQELWIEDIPNPNMVLPDARSTRPDFSDGKRLFAYQAIDKRSFRRRFPEAKLQTFGRELQQLYPKWVKPQTIQLAEFWEVEETDRRLLVLLREHALALLKPELMADADHPIHAHLREGTPSVGVYADELTDEPDDDSIIDDDTSTERTVWKYLTNGVEILEKTEQPGQYIPFVSCFGNILYLDEGAGAQRKILSMTRLARDPYMLYCYYRSCEAELVGMTPKFPYFVYENQMSPNELLNLANSLHKPIAVIQVKPTVEGLAPNQILGYPERQPYEPPLQGLELGAEAARRAIQAAMGIMMMPTQVQRNNDKTGEALKRIESSSQKGSFHFIHARDMMIRRLGEIGEDLMDHVYDTTRRVSVRTPLGKSGKVLINHPTDPLSVNTKGSHLVTVSAGPSEENARDAAGEFIQSLVSSPILLESAGPQNTAKVLAMGIRIQNIGPYGEALADILDPPVGKDMTPQAMQAHIGQLTQQLQAATQSIQQLQFEKKAKQVELQGKAGIEQMKLAGDTSEGDKDRAVKLDIAAIQAKLETMAMVLEELKRIGGLKESMAQRLHDASHTRQERLHDAATAHLGHVQNLAEQAQIHHHTVVEQQQAADLAPVPPADGQD